MNGRVIQALVVSDLALLATHGNTGEGCIEAVAEGKRLMQMPDARSVGLCPLLQASKRINYEG